MLPVQLLQVLLKDPRDPSDDFNAHGLVTIYLGIALSPGRSRMARSLPAALPAPAEFSARNANHIAVLAMLGHSILPPDKATIAKMVDESGSFTALVNARLQEMRDLFAESKPLFAAMGLEISSAPEVRKSKQNVGELTSIPHALLPPSLAKILDRYASEARYLKLKREGRMNRLAEDLGHEGVGALMRYVGEVSEVVNGWGLADYQTMLTPDRLIEHLRSTLAGDDAYEEALKDLQAHRDVLRRRTAAEIWLFVQSRAGRLDDFTFEVEAGVLTVRCREDLHFLPEALVDSYVDGAEMFAATSAPQARSARP